MVAKGTKAILAVEAGAEARFSWSLKWRYSKYVVLFAMTVLQASLWQFAPAPYYVPKGGGKYEILTIENEVTSATTVDEGRLLLKIQLEIDVKHTTDIARHR